MPEVKTVRVQHADPETYPEGMDINEEDFNPEIHTRLDGEPVDTKPKGKDPLRMNKAELQAYLSDLNIQFEESDTKADLLERLPK